MSFVIDYNVISTAVTAAADFARAHTKSTTLSRFKKRKEKANLITNMFPSINTCVCSRVREMARLQVRESISTL